MLLLLFEFRLFVGVISPLINVHTYSMDLINRCQKTEMSHMLSLILWAVSNVGLRKILSHHRNAPAGINQMSGSRIIGGSTHTWMVTILNCL